MQGHRRPECKTILEEDPKPLPNLPQELIVDILSRLPVKSLLRFRCVSKEWLSLISNSHFIRSHVTKWIESKNLGHHGLLLCPIDAPTELYTCSLYSLLYEKSSVNAVKVPLPLQTFPRLSFVGCCNGLFCISDGSYDLIVFNPSTRKFKILPNSGVVLCRFRYLTYGFGYDEIHNDYKAVEIGDFCRHGIKNQTIVSVYSLRTNSWKRIQDYRGGFVASCSCVFVNGALHWLVVSRKVSSFSWVLVSLNLASETYGEVMLPNDELGNFDLTLGVLKGCLCVFCNCLELDVWVMKEYGVKESWTKLARFPYCMSFSGCPLPLFVSEAGEILLKHDFRLMLYNGKDSIFTNRDLRMLGANRPEAAATYIESLVSPNIADEVGH